MCYFSVSPPHVVGYANGIAQSIVSLARFFGPVLGGLVRLPSFLQIRSSTHIISVSSSCGP